MRFWFVSLLGASLAPLVCAAQDAASLTPSQQKFVDRYIAVTNSKSIDEYMHLVSSQSTACAGPKTKARHEKSLPMIVFRNPLPQATTAKFGPPSEGAKTAMVMMQQVGSSFPSKMEETVVFTYPQGTTEVYVTKDGGEYRILDFCEPKS